MYSAMYYVRVVRVPRSPEAPMARLVLPSKICQKHPVCIQTLHALPRPLAMINLLPSVDNPHGLGSLI